MGFERVGFSGFHGQQLSLLPLLPLVLCLQRMSLEDQLSSMVAAAQALQPEAGHE